MIALYAIAGVVLSGLVARYFLTASPQLLARLLRIALPGFVCAAGMVLTALGRPIIGFPLVGLSVVWSLWLMSRPRRTPSAPRHTIVRTAALEMELDSSTGQIEGIVLAGRHEGRTLGAMDRRALAVLRKEVAPDAESVRLLEAYLEGRFPVGGEDAHTDVGAGQACSPASRAMTQQEAYQILGLEPGASAADIRKAHRRLLQGLDADVSDTGFPAARIDEARDFLLSLHG